MEPIQPCKPPVPGRRRSAVPSAATRPRLAGRRASLRLPPGRQSGASRSDRADPLRPLGVRPPRQPAPPRSFPSISALSLAVPGPGHQPRPWRPTSCGCWPAKGSRRRRSPPAPCSMCCGARPAGAPGEQERRSRCSLTWSRGDLFVLPAGVDPLLQAETESVLYWVHDAPLLAYLGVAPDSRPLPPRPLPGSAAGARSCSSCWPIPAQPAAIASAC